MKFTLQNIQFPGLRLCALVALDTKTFIHCTSEIHKMKSDTDAVKNAVKIALLK
jgi:hypothetical protein